MNTEPRSAGSCARAASAVRVLRFVRRHCVVLFVPVSIVLIFKIENPLLDLRYWGISLVVLLLSIIEACSYNAS